MKKLALCVLFVLGFTTPAVAAPKNYQHSVSPTVMEGNGFAWILYEQEPGSIVVEADIIAFDWKPVRGTLTTTTTDGRIDTKDIHFNEVVGSSPWFTSSEKEVFFRETYELGRINEPGLFLIVLSYEDDDGHWARMTFEPAVQEFDFGEIVCLEEGRPLLRFSAISFEGMPEIVSIYILLEDGREIVFNTNFSLGYDGMLGITPTIAFKRYALLAGKRLAVTLDLGDGRVLTQWVTFPHPVNARPTCQLG